MASFSSTTLVRSACGVPRSSSPKPTFSRTVRQGSSANCWKTMAMRLVRSIRNSAWRAAGDVDGAAGVLDQHLARAPPG